MRPLFWSYRFEDLRLPESTDLLMLHTLTYGTTEQRNWLRRRFGTDGIRRWIKGRRGKGLTVEQMQPWVDETTAKRWQSRNSAALIWENR